MEHAEGCTVGSQTRRWRCVPACRLVREPEPVEEQAPILALLVVVALGPAVRVYRWLRPAKVESVPLGKVRVGERQTRR